MHLHAGSNSWDSCFRKEGNSANHTDKPSLLRNLLEQSNDFMLTDLFLMCSVATVYNDSGISASGRSFGIECVMNAGSRCMVASS